ncbi:TonB-dependent receptor [Novosphingobium sp. 9]|uniref:TonB-dependent receptor n=1 Tax=Novosphingobium sp. 9 TaxID=2025349 RepID=UPI0021B52E93|nr:TonB-dependent receptor [Novosphingobium sp. 9]
MIYNARSLRALLLATCMTAAATPAFADDAAPAASTEAKSGDEIVVTAQKRDERLIDVPIPVSVVTGDTLTRENDAQLRDYFTKLPGLSVYSAGNGRSTFVVRGITTGAGNNPTVAMVLDDVPLGSSTGAGLGDQVSAEIDPSDVSQVEVLRGPQGTLYGASSLGGLIKYVSIMPDPTKFSGTVSANGEAIDHGGLGWATRGAVNVPITPTLAVRASGYYRSDAGWVDDATSGAKDVNNGHAYGGKITALWKPTSDFSLLATALLQNRKTNNVSDMDVDVYGTPVYGNYEHSRVAGTGLGDKKVRLYSLRAAYDMGFATLTSITSYSRISFVGPQDVSQTFGRYLSYFMDDTSGTGVTIANNAYSKKWTQEVRLSSNGSGPIDWQLGGFFTHEDNSTYQTIYAADYNTGAAIDILGNGLYNPLYTAADPDTYREFAGYADLTYHFTDKLSLQVGGRYAINRQSSLESLGGILEGYADDTVDTSAAKSKDHAFTFLVSPSYHINDNLMVYARVASGYRPGGPNLVPVTSANRTFGPDRTTNYDLGLKGQIVDHLLSVDLSVFDIEWSKIQLSQTDDSGFSFTGNGGKARSRGVEASTTLTPWQGMSATGTFTYTDATLREDVDVATLYGLKGDRLPYSAKYAGSIDLEQHFVLPGNVNAYVGGTMAYVGNRYSDFTRSASAVRFEMPAFTTYSLRAGIENDGWTYSLYVRNLTDKLGFVSGSARDTITRTGTYAAGVIQPRTIGLSIGKDF